MVGTFVEKVGLEIWVKSVGVVDAESGDAVTIREIRNSAVAKRLRDDPFRRKFAIGLVAISIL